VGERRQLAREVLGDEALRGKMAPGEALELADLAGLEAVGVPEDADGIASRCGGVEDECRRRWNGGARNGATATCFPAGTRGSLRALPFAATLSYHRAEPPKRKPCPTLGPSRS
jgi:hypothetical protein